MNYENLLQKIFNNKKVLIFILIALGVIVLFINSYLNQSTFVSTIAPIDSITASIEPQKSSESLKQLMTNRILANSKLDLSKIPQTVNVYSYSAPSFTETDAYQLLDKLKLVLSREDEDKNLGKVISGKRGNQSIVIYLGRKSFIFNDSSEFTSGITKNIDFFKTRAKQFIESIGLNLTNYEFVSTSYIGGNSTEREVIQDKSLAVSVELVYQFKIDGHHVVYDGKHTYGNFVRIWITNNGQIQKLVYEFGGSVGDKFGQSKILTKEQILQNIASGQAKLTVADISDQKFIQSIEVSDAKIAYFAKDDRILPILFMTGLIKTDKKDTLGYLVMDAIENEQKK